MVHLYRIFCVGREIAIKYFRNPGLAKDGKLVFLGHVNHNHMTRESPGISARPLASRQAEPREGRGCVITRGVLSEFLSERGVRRAVSQLHAAAF